MKLIQTFYVDAFKNITKTAMGWNLPFYNVISWTLSCLQLHKYYDDIALYANTGSAKFFNEILQLPYKKFIHPMIILFFTIMIYLHYQKYIPIHYKRNHFYT
ncbi:MAG: hypothetical protein EKK39_02740 [Sphingobacteriales bacterium]|nr:DUF6734 family protein [Hydrotalea flava]RTL55519.1 MAG: hypothetical protein EKK39_02740 [Sphingobacteriales bacterium]